VQVEVPPTAEYVAIGAARQAAWALTGELPTWAARPPMPLPASDPQTADAVRSAYHHWRAAVHGV
jgi:xylulokinase